MGLKVGRLLTSVLHQSDVVPPHYTLTSLTACMCIMVFVRLSCGNHLQVEAVIAYFPACTGQL